MARNTHNHLTPWSDLSSDGPQLGPRGQIEAVREAVVDEIEAAKANIENQISQLKRMQVDTELDDAITQLEMQLSHLDSLSAAAHTGNVSILMGLNRNMPTMLANNARISAVAHTEAVFHSAHLVHEMTDEIVHHYHQLHDRQAVAFASYEQQNHGRIQQWAADNGVDISNYMSNRDELLREKEEARAKGNRLKVFEMDALLAANNEQATRKVGAPAEEIQRAGEEAQAARDRYLREVEFKAREQARQEGLTDDKAINYIAQARLSAERDLDKRIEQLAQSNGVSTARDADVATKDQATIQTETTSQDQSRNEKTDVVAKADAVADISLDDGEETKDVQPPSVPDHSSKTARSR